MLLCHLEGVFQSEVTYNHKHKNLGLTYQLFRTVSYCVTPKCNSCKMSFCFVHWSSYQTAPIWGKKRKEGVKVIAKKLVFKITVSKVVCVLRIEFCSIEKLREQKWVFKSNVNINEYEKFQLHYQIKEV